MSVVHELQTVLCWKSVVILVCWPQRTRGCSIHVTVADPSAVHLGQSGLPFYIRRGYAFTEGEWQNWFCSFLGVPLPSMLALIANNRKCPCGRPYDAHAHHVNTCIHCNKTPSAWPVLRRLPWSRRSLAKAISGPEPGAQVLEPLHLDHT